MELNSEEKERVSKLTPFMKLVYETLMKWIKMLIYGECDEETITNAASKIESSTQGYVHEDDYVTVDMAMKILGLGQNRVKCINLLRMNNIRNETFNNVKIGYNRDKVVALKKKLRDEYEARRIKQLNKERREAAKRNKGRL